MLRKHKRNQDLDLFLSIPTLLLLLERTLALRLHQSLLSSYRTPARRTR